MFIGELGAAAIRQGNTWVAVAEVTVLDGDDQPVAGALVSGAWDEGDTDTTACITDQSGRCELESGSIRRRVSQTTVAITDVEHDELSYQPELDAVDNPEDQPRELAIRKP